MEQVAARQLPEMRYHDDEEKKRGAVDPDRGQLPWRHACIDHEPPGDAVGSRERRRALPAGSTTTIAADPTAAPATNHR